MADPVLERDLQELKDLEEWAEGGDKLSARALLFRLSGLVSRSTKWQWVIHGDTVRYRGSCVRWLVRQARYTTARRFALCGRGDIGALGDEPGALRITPKGCGCRFCPRCSRRFGRRFLKRVGSHLASHSHGSLWHIVLTQRVRGGEGLQGARERFSEAWKRFYRELRACGMQAGLATYHVTRSSVKGWHWHCHLLAEFDDGVDESSRYEKLDRAWFAALRDPGSLRKPLFMRAVCAAGPALTGLGEERQLEFWTESHDPVEKVLQYVLRDVLQGVEGWIGRIQEDGEAEEFAEALSHAKLHRLYGDWRREVECEKEEEEESPADLRATGEKASKGCGVVVVWTALGSMDEVFWKAKGGEVRCRELVRRLLARSSNKGVVALRTFQLARECAM